MRGALTGSVAGAEFQRVVQIGESFYAGRYEETLERVSGS
jgi:hypothetical protein